MEDKTSSPPSNAAPSGDEPLAETRPALLEKARAFLSSPDVLHENEASKRVFLKEKGLTDQEIDALLKDLPRQPPPIPPRTYPLPPPSNLPALLAGLFNAFTWLAGASSVLVFGYYRFLLPLLGRNLAARHQLKLHQYEHLGRLYSALQELKETQTLAFDNLYDIPDPPADVKSFADVPVNAAGEPTLPIRTVIRCAFLGDNIPKLTLENLYEQLLTAFVGLKAADESEYKGFLLRELSCSNTFEKITENDTEYWTLRGQSTDGSSLPARASSLQSLSVLRDLILRGQRKQNAYEHTFKSLTDLTAYLSQETFAKYGASTGFRYGLPSAQPLNPAEEDVRKEIRALKGLVLNRRTFASSTPRPPPAPASASASAI